MSTREDPAVEAVLDQARTELEEEWREIMARRLVADARRGLPNAREITDALGLDTTAGDMEGR